MTQEPKLLDRLRNSIRARHYSHRTEEAYLMWAKRFILFHNKRHPSSMSGDEVNAFLSSVAARIQRHRRLFTSTTILESSTMNP